MNKQQLLDRLKKENLRLADALEAGYTYTYCNEHQCRVTVWVTDIS